MFFPSILLTFASVKSTPGMNKKYYKYIYTLFIVFPMTLIMAFVGLMRNYGFGPEWAMKFLKAWSVMFPVAYICAFIIIPRARKLADRINWKES